MKKVMVLAVLTAWSTGAMAGTTGTYKVPAGAFLDQDVLLKAPRVNVSEKGDGTIALDYRLPHELDGSRSRRIKLESVSPENKLQLKGPEAVALCEPVSRSFSCTIHYFKDQTSGIFGLDTESAASYMEARQFSTERVQLMEKAQQSIMHEAAGILFIRRR